jgi:hypothetical protein
MVANFVQEGDERDHHHDETWSKLPDWWEFWLKHLQIMSLQGTVSLIITCQLLRRSVLVTARRPWSVGIFVMRWLRMTRNEQGRKRSWPTLRYYSDIRQGEHWEKVQKTYKALQCILVALFIT